MSAAARGISCRCAWLPASLREPLPRADRLGVAVLAPCASVRALRGTSGRAATGASARLAAGH